MLNPITPHIGDLPHGTNWNINLQEILKDLSNPNLNLRLCEKIEYYRIRDKWRKIQYNQIIQECNEEKRKQLEQKTKKLEEELEGQLKEISKKQTELEHRLYVIEHKEEIEWENYKKNYKNAYQQWIEISGNGNKTELEFVNQLDKKFLKRSGKPLWDNKQIKYIINIYFENNKNENFFTGNNDKKFILYKKIYKRTCYRYDKHCYDKNPYDKTYYNKGYYFICTDYGFKNLYVLDENGKELENGSRYYEEARKCFSKTIKEMVIRKNQKYTKFYNILI